MASYVLVHGGEHGGWCWRKVAMLLRAVGHHVLTPTLTGLGERIHLMSAAVDLAMHVTDVANTLVYDDLRDVILVGHSYGGMVITGAADRAIDRIGQLVYLDAAHPRDGEALTDVAPEMMAMAYRQMQLIDGIEMIHLPPALAVQYFGVTDPADEAWMVDRLKPHPWRCYSQPLRLADEAAARRLPRTNINCTQALQASTDGNRARQLDGDRNWEIDTGHDIMITQPEALAEMLLLLV